jgi:hypothetical protein
MSVAQISAALQNEVIRRAYLRRVEILDQSISLIKARLHIAPDLFIQIYRNDRFDTTNFALIHNGQRLYARDQVGGIWHRHAIDQPAAHDVGPEGRRAVDLSQFLDEVESILAALGLP